MIEYDFKIIDKFWKTFYDFLEEHNIKREEVDDKIIEALSIAIMKTAAIEY